jgi:type IV secretory pathway VirD2 relaxase
MSSKDEKKSMSYFYEKRSDEFNRRKGNIVAAVEGRR